MIDHIALGAPLSLNEHALLDLSFEHSRSAQGVGIGNLAQISAGNRTIAVDPVANLFSHRGG